MMEEELCHRTPVTRAELKAGCQSLGLRHGSVVMAHCRLSSFGYVVGGLETMVRALLESLGPEGTVMALAGWPYDPSPLTSWPEPVQSAYRNDPPIFDPAVSESEREFGRLAERIRTWPGAHRSNHPEASFAAVGRLASWLMADQPWDHPYGPGSALAKLVAAKGDIIMLGAPLETLTVLHHAEELAEVSDKKLVTYEAPVRVGNDVVWREVNDIDTTAGAFPYDRVVPGDKDAFEVIATEALSSGIGRRHQIGEAEVHLFPAPELVAFAVAWMEQHFG
jgi:aminoglycoside 3-N-acetyltransferase